MKTLKNSILNFLMLALLSISFSANAQFVQTQENQFNGFSGNNNNTIQPFLEWKGLGCPDNLESCQKGKNLSPRPNGQVMQFNSRKLFLTVHCEWGSLDYMKAFVKDTNGNTFPINILLPYTHNIQDNSKWVVVLNKDSLEERGFNFDGHQRYGEILLQGYTSNGKRVYGNQKIGL